MTQRLALPLLAGSLAAQQSPAARLGSLDSDRDGLSDALEQQLLQQFKPVFMIAAGDCSHSPAQFEPGAITPLVLAENGTIYGQVFPVQAAGGDAASAEVHFYHLWRRDCGAHGHPLDTEHVAVLVRASGADISSATWTAQYWYAAAHEDTVCDASQIARASTLHATEQGATVWISPGKHASYLRAALCRGGCGADRCETMVPLETTAPINLGELSRPMNGTLFTPSQRWPLQAKMAASNFPADALARLGQLPESDIAWFKPGPHPAQGVIATSNTTGQALAHSGVSTGVALRVAGTSTNDALLNAGDALSAAGTAAGGALSTSYRQTHNALGSAAQHVRNALRLSQKRSADACIP